MKKIVSSLLTFVIIFALLPMGALEFSAKAATSGTTGECTWSLDGTTLTISGNGNIGDYSYSIAAPWGTEIAEVIIEDGVTSIGDHAFYNCKNLTSITIPNSVESIGDYAFRGCTSIVNVDVPNSVSSIGEDAFCMCYSLASIIIPDSVTSIEAYTFWGCDQLESVIIGNGVESIGSVAFNYCASLKSITIGNNVKSICDWVFAKCDALESITIPDSVTSIGNYAFDQCDRLREVYYMGSRDDKEKISIGSYNDKLISATWYYNACVGTAEHTYDNVCDANCNICEFVRVAPHSYDNDCDVDCSGCGETRIRTHKFEWIIDKENNCGVDGFKHEECEICHTVRNEMTKISATGEHVFAGDSDGECGVCGQKFVFIQFDSNGGTGISRLEVLADHMAMLPSEVPSKSGYKFAGWATSKNGDVEYEQNASIYADKSITLYAQWDKICEPYLYEECADCFGVGEVYSHSIECYSCGGSGLSSDYCYTCDGSGTKLCSKCNGTCVDDCAWCEGTGANKNKQVVCTVCGGSGNESCSVGICNTCSNAIGYTVRDYDGSCKRAGHNVWYTCTQCSTCGGDGKVPEKCYWCAGSGIYSCVLCSGTGKYKCSICNGTGVGDCYTCYGTGQKKVYKTCDNCTGNGKIQLTCSLCDGTGTVIRKSVPSPSAPVVHSYDENIVVLQEISNGEYSIDGVNWQESPVFEGLVVGQQYTFYQRYAKTDTTLQSLSSEGITVTTQHTYDNDCDTTCNVCQAVRVVEPHKYLTMYLADSENHWKECAICGEKSDYNNHIYDNDCDKDCNVCGAVRTVSEHNYNSATCTNPKTCKYCGETEGEALGHNYFYVDPDYVKPTCTESATNLKKCLNCGGTKLETIPSLGGHKFSSSSCLAVCSVCDETRRDYHNFETTITKATTTKDGKITDACSYCSVSHSNTIYKASSVKFKASSTTYNGMTKRPTVVVKDSKGNTISTSNYTIKYPSSMKNAGTYSVKVTFKGNYSRSKTLTYTINPIKSSTCKVKLSKTSYTYDGKTKTPSVTVKNANGTTLKKNTHYTVTYSTGRKYVGKYKVTIKFKGNYSGTETLYFTINPAKTTLKSVSGSAKSLKVSINKKTTQVSGYEIQYSTSKKFTSAKTKIITSTKTTSTTIKSLKAKTTYYVRVRTYKTVNGKKYYSGWSSYKSAKTK